MLNELIRCREGFRSRSKSSKGHCFGRQWPRIPMGRWWVGTYIRWAARRRTTVLFFCVKGKRYLTAFNVRFDSIHSHFQRLNDRRNASLENLDSYGLGLPWVSYVACTICYICGFRAGFSMYSSHVLNSLWRSILFVHDTPYSILRRFLICEPASDN